VITSDGGNWARTMAVEEYGRAPAPKFILCGLVPLVSYLLTGDFALCIIATGAIFFAIGAVKSRWSLASWWRSGLEKLLIGTSAAALVFGVGFGLRSVVSLGDVTVVPVPPLLSLRLPVSLRLYLRLFPTVGRSHRSG
jgi:predicted membrane protein